MGRLEYYGVFQGILGGIKNVSEGFGPFQGGLGAFGVAPSWFRQVF